jgi:hypothetical protein
MEVRAAAELLGRLAACKTSHGKVLHIQSRHMQHQVGSAAEAAGWDCAIVWQVESLQELRWIQENLGRFNDKMYWGESRGFEKLGLKETREARRQITISKREEAEAKRVAEQSGTDSCIIGQDREQKWVQDYVDENGSWIADGLTELKAAVLLLQKILQNEERHRLVQGRTIY